MKTVLWVDDLRPAPDHPGEQYIVAKSVNQAKAAIELCEKELWEQPIDYISIDHDSGLYNADGGDFINILNWLEYRQHTQNGKVYPVHIHTMNPVGYVNMRAIIQANNWKEVL